MGVKKQFFYAFANHAKREVKDPRGPKKGSLDVNNIN